MLLSDSLCSAQVPQAQGARCLGKWLLLVAAVWSLRGCLGRAGLRRHIEVHVCAGWCQAEAEGGGGLQHGNLSRVIPLVGTEFTWALLNSDNTSCRDEFESSAFTVPRSES